MYRFFSFFLILSFFCVKANVVFSQVSSCAEIVPEPEIVMTTSYGELKYDKTKSLKELTEVGKQFGVVEKGLFAAGLSTIKINWEISVETISHFSPETSEICVIPIKVNLFVGYQDPIIYVSKGLKEETCQYELVLRHEQTHQQINKKALDYYIPRIKLLMNDVSKDVKPIKIDDFSDDKVAAVNESISKKYISYVEPMVDVLKQELMKEQKKLDNMDNYQMEGELCKK